MALRKYYLIFLLSDPEATESSSGGESADEADWAAGGGTGAAVGVEGGAPAARYAPIHERAKYRWLQKVSRSDNFCILGPKVHGARHIF